MQTGRVLKETGWEIFGTCPNWVVSYIAYTKFHSPRPVFHSPSQIFTHIGERASASFPAWETHNIYDTFLPKCQLKTYVLNYEKWTDEDIK